MKARLLDFFGFLVTTLNMPPNVKNMPRVIVWGTRAFVREAATTATTWTYHEATLYVTDETMESMDLSDA